jgi:hypothetical protein
MLLGEHFGFTAFPDAGVYWRTAGAGAHWLGSGEEWRWHLEGDGYSIDTASLAATFDDTFDAGFNYVAGFLGAPAAVTGTSADGHYFPTTSLGLTRTTSAAADFAATLKARADAAGKQAIFKVYNELNQPQFDTAGASVATKADYVAAIMLGARAGAPDLPIAGMSLAARGDLNNPADAGITAPGMATALFNARPDLYTNPALKPDYVAMHPYSYADGAANTKGWGGWVQLDALRTVLDLYGWADVPILVTEVGHPSGATADNPIWTLERQATELDLIFKQLAWRTFVAKTSNGVTEQVAFPWLIFTEHDYDGGTGNDLGLSYADGSPKPALDVFKTWAAIDLAGTVDPPPPPDPPIGWGSVTDGWESETLGWDTVGTVPPGPPYSPIRDTAVTRRPRAWSGAAPSYRPHVYE